MKKPILEIGTIHGMTIYELKAKAEADAMQFGMLTPSPVEEIPKDPAQYEMFTPSQMGPTPEENEDHE